MKEHPIIFNAAMVRALLENRKTQTRRPIRPQPIRINDCFDGTWEWKEEDHYYDNLTLADMLRGHCPFQAGKKLWVRETWHAARQYDELKPSLLPIGSTLWYAKDCCSHGWASRGKKRVSIYMPRWASRITLEVVRVRIEQVQDITEADARAEGVEP